MASRSASTQPAEPSAGRPADYPGAAGTSPADQTPPRRRLRRRWLVIAVALVAVAAIVAVELPQWLSPAPQTTIWQKITSGITDGTVPKQTALEAFAYLYTVDIPDVVVPSGVEGGDAPVSGTGAMRWVQSNWNQLSAAQQAVIDRYLPPETTRGTHQMTPAPSAAAFAPGVAQFAPGLAPANSGVAVARALVDRSLVRPEPPRLDLNGPLGVPFETYVAPDVSPDLAVAIADDMSSIIVHLGNKLGVPVLNSGPEQTPDVTLTLTDTVGGKTPLDTHDAAWSDGHYSPCNVTVYRNAWGNAAWTANDQVGSVLHVMLTHELIHCYQFAVVGDIYNSAAMPSWIMEGTADYLAVDDTGTVGPGDAGAWQDYLTAEVSLTNRNYDAMGYYALLAHLGRDLWGKMATAWKAAANSLNRSDAFIYVLHGDDSDVRAHWAESYVNNSAWQDPWVLPGLGAPVDTSALQHEITALAAPGWNGILGSRSNTLLSVNATSGEVMTIATYGLASVHDFQGHISVDFQSESFCTVESCVCPAGTALAGQDVATRQLSIPAIVAVNAPNAPDPGTKYAVISSTLEDLCKRPATPAPQPQTNKGPCGSNCTNSNGDPHMLTVSKNRYDFQAAGEFTLLNSADGSLDIQARQEPVGKGYASINTAIAAKVGSHRVGVYMTQNGLEAHLDGSPLDLTAEPKDLGGGARIAAIANGFEIDFADGTKLWAVSVGPYGINAQISPSESLRTSGVGLLGPVVPGGLGVPALPDGTRLPAETDATQYSAVLYGQFADAWRLTDATTLFDYDSGKTTASYTVKPYPDAPKYQTLTDLSSDQTAAGTSACSAITDQGLHDECVFDVGVTGQAGFADTYAATQTFYDTGVEAATPTPPPAPSDTPAPGTVSGAVTVTQGTRIGGYALGPDDTAYLSVQTVDNKFSLIAFDTKSGNIATQVDVAALTPVHFAAGSVWLPGIKTDANGRNCSVTRYDATTLAEQATVTTPCSPFDDAPPMVSDGDALWFVDTSKVDISTNLGAVITRIDPTTNAPGTSVQVPILGLNLLDSQGALFFFDTDSNYWRLTIGSTAPDSLGTMPSYAVPGGTGLWVSPDRGKTAQYFTSAGSPAATVQTGGEPVAGDAKAVYVDVFANSDQGTPEDQLWRYPIDGSTPTKIAAGPTLDGDTLGYAADPQPIANGDGVIKLWTTHSGSNQTSLILLQWTATP